MYRLYLTLIVCVIMGALVPLASYMAVAVDSATESPLYTHFIYMFGHANWMHWMINCWSLLVLHNIFRWYRLLAAYAMAVVLSFMPICNNTPVFGWLTEWIGLPESNLPVIGASVITSFFFGFITPHYWYKERTVVFMMAGLLLVGCILPGVTGFFHVIPYITGILAVLTERLIKSLHTFIGE